MRSISILGGLIDLRVIKDNQFLSVKEETGFQCTNYSRSAPNLEVNYQEFTGQNGAREVDKAFRAFDIEVSLFSEFDNYWDCQLIESELFDFLYTDDNYYIVSDREPGKKYKVRVTSCEVDTKDSAHVVYNITFNVFEGHSESITSTLSDFSLDDEWQFSQGIESEDYEYILEKSRFVIYNAGDFAVDPRTDKLKITVRGESGGNVAIYNKTTGDRFIYYPTLSNTLGQSLVLEGVYPKLNGINCGIDTNLNLISLAPGENEIEISSLSNVEVSWDFNFLYK